MGCHQNVSVSAIIKKPAMDVIYFSQRTKFSFRTTKTFTVNMQSVHRRSPIYTSRYDPEMHISCSAKLSEPWNESSYPRNDYFLAITL
jgi:hypothetical protein